jgi:uncharacterized protein (DUF305 family)
MKNQSILLLLGGTFSVLIGLAVGYVVWGNDGDFKGDDDWHQMSDGTMMGGKGGSMHGMDHSMMVVKSEREFLEGMIPHHQEAVDTAKEVIARGGSTPEIKKLAEDIVVAQEKEIAMMKDWYQAWYGEAYVGDPKDYKPMMRDLSKLSGAALDKVFLEDMIMHHMGAVMMAQSVQSHIEHSEMSELTKAIIKTQTEEIQSMRVMLGTL